MKVIYLACGKARLNFPNVVYNDLFEDCDLKIDMMSVDLTPFDFILASPPCNYYSRARGNCPPSAYALETAHLLPDILNKLISSGKPFVVENVRNKPLFLKLGLFNFPCFVYFHGRHTYWTNIMIDFHHISQSFDFRYGGKKLKSYIQGGDNVNNVFDFILSSFLTNRGIYEKNY